VALREMIVQAEHTLAKSRSFPGDALDVERAGGTGDFPAVPEGAEIAVSGVLWVGVVMTARKCP